MTIIKSRDNPLVKQIAKLNKSSKYRRESGLFIAEGCRLVNDAVKSGCNIEFFVFSESAVKNYNALFESANKITDRVHIFSDALFAHICDTKSPQGVLAAVKLLDKKCLFDKIKNDGKLIALENLQDPGNLGTVFRTAEALGIDGIVMTKDCCDIYSPKVVRSTMGAVFRMPFAVVDSIAEFLKKNKNIKSYAAVVNTESRKITEVNFDFPCVCVIGNEGNGLKAETVNSCDYAVTIPMTGRAESLNASVAASIIMWEMMK